jgi:hypothetical protein
MTAESTSVQSPSRERFLESFIGLESTTQPVSSAPFTAYPETPSMRRFLDSFSGLGPSPRPAVRKAQPASSDAEEERVRARLENYFRD